jgi:hypothetical protein
MLYIVGSSNCWWCCRNLVSMPKRKKHNHVVDNEECDEARGEDILILLSANLDDFLSTRPASSWFVAGHVLQLRMASSKLKSHFGLDVAGWAKGERSAWLADARRN